MVRQRKNLEREEDSTELKQSWIYRKLGRKHSQNRKGMIRI